jgi:multiple sugar transport system substrate-binding protein
MNVTRAAVLRGALAAAAATATGALAACATGSSAGGETSPSKKPVKLSFEWPTYTQPKQEWAQWAVNTYMQKFPHVTVEPLWNNNPTQILTTTLASGQPPDVGWFGAGHWPFYEAFKPIEQFISARKIKMEDYFPKLVDAMKWRGKMLAFPMGINTTAMFVNKAAWQKAGLPVPTDDFTWDDLVNVGKRLTTGEGPQKVWATDAAAGYYTNFWPAQYGGTWIDADGTKVTVNNPQTLKVFTMMRDNWDKLGIAPNPKEFAEINTNATAPFTEGRIAFFAGGTWGIDPGRKVQSFDWDIVEAPTLVDSGKKIKGAFCGTEEIFVIKGGPNEEAAADFAAWLIGPEHLTHAGNIGQIIPAHQKTAQSAFVNPQGETRPKNLQAFVRAANYAPAMIPHPAYGDLSKAWAASYNKWAGTAAAPDAQLTAQAALDEAQKEMQRILDEWNKAHPK